MLSDWELWAIAKRLIDDRGEDAALAAAMRRDEMIDRSDIEGQRVWLAVAQRINRIEAKAGEGDRLN